MKIYFAAPLFTQAERDWNQNRAAELTMQVGPVYLPQRDGGLYEDGRLTPKAIFEADFRAIRDCQVMVAVLNGAEIDTGVAVELGMACALAKPIIGFRDDPRLFMYDLPISLMAHEAIDLGIFDNFEAIVTRLMGNSG